MEVRALVASTDHNTASLLRRSFNSVGVTPEEGVKVEDVLGCVRRMRYEAIVVDLTQEGGPELLTALRSDNCTKSSVLFALANGKISMRDAFQMGATFVLEKPLSLDRSLRCFRAAYGLIIGERRRYYRHRISIGVSILGPGGDQAGGSSVDLSTGGMLVETNKPLAEDTQVKVHFGLPRVDEKMAVACEVVWAQEGRAGLRFLRFSRNSKEALSSWLTQQIDREMGSTVTDMKMPAQL